MSSEHEDQEWADRFAVLGDVNRLRLLIYHHGPISVGALAQRTGLKLTTVSHALRLLRVYGSADTTRDGRLRLYRISDDRTAALLDHVSAEYVGADRRVAVSPDM